jgi:hypothetical protein
VTSFAWCIEDASGGQSSSQSFATQEEAEAWLGETWSELLEGGAEEVSLMNEGQPLYRMSLRADS